MFYEVVAVDVVVDVAHLVQLTDDDVVVNGCAGFIDLGVGRESLMSNSLICCC